MSVNEPSGQLGLNESSRHMSRRARLVPTATDKLNAHSGIVADPGSIVAIRDATFAPIKIKVRGKNRCVSRLEAYLEYVADVAPRGDMRASGEILRIRKILEGGGQLIATPSVNRLRFLERVKKHELLAEIGQKFLVQLYLEMFGEFGLAYEKTHGPRVYTDDLAPDYIDRDLLGRWRRALRRARPSEPDYKVGYKRPPLETRFKPRQSGNPSGRRASQTAGESFEKILLERLEVRMANGKKTKISKMELSISQTFDKAMRGDPKAQRTVRLIMTALSEHGMLSPPPRRKRERQTISGPEKLLYWLAAVHTIAHLKRDMIKKFTKVYGEIAEFTTGLEQRLSAFRQLEAFGKLEDFLKKRSERFNMEPK